MAKNSIDAYGASGKTNVLMFEPEKLHLVTDKTHLLYDERINLPIDEGMVLNIKELGVLEPIIVWKDPETGLTCVVVGRQRVKHTLEANKLRLKEGKDPLLVPGVVKRGSANQMAKYMVSENEIRRPDTPLGRAKKMSDALDRGLDARAATVGEPGAADQVFPDRVAAGRAEAHVQRDLLGIGAAAAQAFEVAGLAARSRVGIPGPADGLPQRPRERLVVVLEAVLPPEEGGLCRGQLVDAEMNAHGFVVDFPEGCA